MSRFAAQGALEYDRRISTLVPGYDALHQLSAAILKPRLPDTARILIVGAGTAAEIIELAKQNPNWHFTALDPSAAMLTVARDKCIEAGIRHVDFITGYLSDLPLSQTYDAALALLVMHFIQSPANKQQFMTQIHQHLTPGAPLLLCDLMQMNASDRQMLIDYAVGRGLPTAQRVPLRQRLETEFFTLSAERFTELATAAGFTEPYLYFQLAAFHSFLLTKK